MKRIYGPGYLNTEDQLPFMAGYIFMTAVQTKKLGKLLRPKNEDIVSSKILMQAAATLNGMIESGQGASQIKILNDRYDIEVEFEREGQEDATQPATLPHEVPLTT